jgi:hypothetical protein
MPQLDISNFLCIICFSVISFLFCFISYQKKLLYSWKKIFYIIEIITNLVIFFSLSLTTNIVKTFTVYFYFILNTFLVKYTFFLKI